MSKIKLDVTSEQNILNMLLDHSVINDNQLSKINSTSSEVGKTKLETAIELNLANEEKIVSVLASSYSLEIVNLSEKKIDQKIKQVLDLRFIEENFIVPFEISGSTLKIAIPDASKLSLMKNLKTMTQMEPELYASSISDIKQFVDRLKNLETKKINPSNVKI